MMMRRRRREEDDDDDDDEDDDDWTGFWTQTEWGDSSDRQVANSRQMERRVCVCVCVCVFRKFQKLLAWGGEGACDVWYVQSEAEVWGVVYTVQVTVAYKLQALVYDILARCVGSRVRKSCRMWSQENFTGSNAIHLTVVNVNVLLAFIGLFAHDHFIIML